MNCVFRRKVRGSVSFADSAYLQSNAASKEVKRPGHTPYMVHFFGTNGGVPYLFPAILSEENLTNMGQTAVDRDRTDTLEEGKENYRYSVPEAEDATYCCEAFAWWMRCAYPPVK